MAKFSIWLAAFFLSLALLSVCQEVSAQAILKENMLRAQGGSFIVAEQNKTYTLLLVQAKNGPICTMEEVTVPMQRLPAGFSEWQQWLTKGAPGHTCWVRYRLNLDTGKMLDYYSFIHKGWCALTQADNLLATLLGLDFTLIPASERKKIGPQPSVATADKRAIWQPRLVIEGKVIAGAPFDAWRARWPRDASDLSGRVIEVYLPQKGTSFPSHFPYWLEIERLESRGLAGRVKVRIIDSGYCLTSPYGNLS